MVGTTSCDQTLPSTPVDGVTIWPRVENLLEHLASHVAADLIVGRVVMIRHLKILVDNSGLFNILGFVMSYRDDLSPRVRKVICVTSMLFGASVEYGFT